MQTKKASLSDSREDNTRVRAPGVSTSPAAVRVGQVSSSNSMQSDEGSIASTVEMWQDDGSDSDASVVLSLSSPLNATRFQPPRDAKASGELDVSVDSDLAFSQSYWCSQSSQAASPCDARPVASLDSSATCSSPGFEILQMEYPPKDPNSWEPASWPRDVERLHTQIKPIYCKFPSVSMGGMCRCKQSCTTASCENAKNNRFCCRNNCSFAGMCGNALKESKRITICKSPYKGGLGLVASRAIPRDTIIGEYFGNIELFGPPRANGYPNNGYILHLKTPSESGKRYGVDASVAGGLFRLANHACNPCAAFHEVQIGRYVTVAVVTDRDVFPGDEITVSYGDALWFICRRGWDGCQHRDIQHLPDL
ncbi:SET domain-containing protein [Phytophthora infestans]|uniref:SET domain-containing protein n=1 Tax=Phytophthora infestans TaxID=4787 RepID=A0A833TQS5_PHYIN|nr:SET domain-containing protein [Phytophthora infestans]